MTVPAKAGKADFSFNGIEPKDPHAHETFTESKLRWEQTETEEGQSIPNYYKQLIALKRASHLGPRNLEAVQVSGDEATGIITVQTMQTLTVLNFSGREQAYQPAVGWELFLTPDNADGSNMNPYSARIFRRQE